MSKKPDVFINYRTGDGEQIAALLQEGITRRFGENTVFRDGGSLRPGEPFPTGLLDALRASSVCLAVIGRGWATSELLRRDDDWVRRELLEALNRGITIFPVLIDDTGWLKASALPPELARLADLQAMRVHSYDYQRDLAEIGDHLTDVIPEFAELERHAAQGVKDVPVGDSVRNKTGDNTGRGTTVQARDTGDISTSGDTCTTHTSIGQASGHINTGTGDQHSHHHAPRLGDGSSYVAGNQSGGGNRNTFGSDHRDRDDDR